MLIVAETGQRTRRSRRIPWLALALLAGTAYLFWVLPHQLPESPVKVEFETSDLAK